MGSTMTQSPYASACDVFLQRHVYAHSVDGSFGNTQQMLQVHVGLLRAQFLADCAATLVTCVWLMNMWTHTAASAVTSDSDVDHAP